MDENFTAIEITISRVVTPSGDLAVLLKTPEHFSAVEVLGLLEAAKVQIFRDMAGQ